MTLATSAMDVMPFLTFSKPSARSGRIPCATAILRISSAGARSTVRSRISSVIGHHLVEPRPALVAGVAAAAAADRLVGLEVEGHGEAGALERGHAERGAGACSGCRAGARAAAPRRRDSRGREEGLDAHLGEPGDRRRRVVGVQRREDEVAGQRRLDRDLGRLAVADLADHDHVGVRAQHRAQAAGERRGPAFEVHLDLVDARQLVLDRVLDRDDVALGLVDRVERARRAWWTCPSRSGRSPGRRRAARRKPASKQLARSAPTCRAGRGRSAPPTCRGCAARSPRRPRAASSRRGCRSRGPSTVSDMRPSCGTRFSAMSRSAMIFTRETTPATIRRGIVVVSRSTPSTRKRTRISRPSGSKWMSEARSSTAWAMIELTSLMTGASSADSRISVTSASSASPSSTASATASSSRLMRPIRPWMSSGGGDHRAAPRGPSSA